MRTRLIAAVDHVAEVDRLDVLAGGLLPGELDQLGGERGELADLGVEVAQQFGAVLGRQAVRQLGLAFDREQQLDVGTDAGQRRPQLVTGVLDQGALRPRGRCRWR